MQLTTGYYILLYGVDVWQMTEWSQMKKVSSMVLRMLDIEGVGTASGTIHHVFISLQISVTLSTHRFVRTNYIVYVAGRRTKFKNFIIRRTGKKSVESFRIFV